MGDGIRYMQFGMDSLNNISQKIIDRELKYADTIILGDNSSGKSLLLRMLVEKAGNTDSVYFIDAVNRGFDVTKVSNDIRESEYKRTIINTRIQEEYFNIKDSFNCYGTVTERIEEMYYPLEDKLQALFESLTNEHFHIIKGNNLGEVQFKEGKALLSSGYQAIVRILLELLYYQEKCVITKHLECTLIIIDELDEFLSPAYARKIFVFLKENFPEMEFVITTHSCDLVAGAKNSNLVILDESGYEVIDVNDYQSISEVQIVFDRIFGVHLRRDFKTEDVLRRLLNNKLNNAWTEMDQSQLETLQKKKLTASQQLICKQITEW